jgi:hypothetical protein
MPMVDADRFVKAIQEAITERFESRMDRLEDQVARQCSEIVKLRELVRELKTGTVEIEAVRINGKWLKVADL